MHEVKGYRGKTILIDFEIDKPEFIPGATLHFTAKRSHRDSDPVIVSKQSGTGIIVDQATGKGQVKLDPADTQGLLNKRLYCDLQLDKNGDSYPLNAFWIVLSDPVRD